MPVGEQDRVDAADVVGNCLRAEVGGGAMIERTACANGARERLPCSSMRIDGRVRRSRGRSSAAHRAVAADGGHAL